MEGLVKAKKKKKKGQGAEDLGGCSLICACLCLLVSNGEIAGPFFISSVRMTMVRGEAFKTGMTL